MTSGLWVAGQSHAAIAVEFGVAPATVKDWATSASRVIRALMEADKEDIRARMLATLDTVVAKAMGKQSASMAGELYDAPDLKAAVAALETQAKLLGLVVTKHDVSTRTSVAHLSRAEHLAELDKLAKEIALESKRVKEAGE